MLALQKLKVADHMLTMTYPLVEDPKILLAVLENIQASMDHAIHDKLLKARQDKKIPRYSETEQGRYAAFREHLAQNYSKKTIRHIKEVYETLQEHKKSPVEFRRKEKFVICDDNYDTKTLSEATLREYIETAKELL